MMQGLIAQAQKGGVVQYFMVYYRGTAWDSQKYDI